MQLLNFPNGGGGPKPEDDRFWEKALELDMALSPHMSFGGVINIGGAASRHVAVAGRGGHDPARATAAGAPRWRS